MTPNIQGGQGGVMSMLGRRVSGEATPLNPAIETWQKPFDGPGSATATFAEAVRETEEVVPVNVSTWVLSLGVTVGR
ncbi:hypothetical protein HEP81_00063 [Streptomyces griseofuscus]|uniref:Uncharacterized protein n=1 Tax=Streptomyces griseofuscus TaxID=146922 RepID=A0A7H1PQS1_9ACTN|nr:hypothetical protein HEP81_00063 [Streptomyces griseofuscus]